MYKNASRNSQYAVSHIQLSNLMSGDQELTSKESYESYKEAYLRLIDINKLETNKQLKKQYGLKLQQMCRNMGKYKQNALEETPMQVSEYIIQIFKERLSREEWIDVVKEAKLRAIS